MDLHLIKLPQANDYAERLKLMHMICLDRTKSSIFGDEAEGGYSKNYPRRA